MAWNKFIACKQIGFGDYEFLGWWSLAQALLLKNRGALNLGLLDKVIGLEKPISH
jgi:hypothetical protein